jgi:hypothetical protein
MWCGSEPSHADLPSLYPRASHHSASDEGAEGPGSTGSTQTDPVALRVSGLAASRAALPEAQGVSPARPSALARQGRSYLGHRDLRRKEPD